MSGDLCLQKTKDTYRVELRYYYLDPTLGHIEIAASNSRPLTGNNGALNTSAVNLQLPRVFSAAVHHAHVQIQAGQQRRLDGRHRRPRLLRLLSTRSPALTSETPGPPGVFRCFGTRGGDLGARRGPRGLDFVPQTVVGFAAQSQCRRSAT